MIGITRILVSKKTFKVIIMIIWITGISVSRKKKTTIWIGVSEKKKTAGITGIGVSEKN